jgi:hypothetical protein
MLTFLELILDVDRTVHRKPLKTEDCFVLDYEGLSKWGTISYN